MHDLSARLTYLYSKTTNQGVAQDIINANYTLRLNYIYNKRYALEGDVALMGSNRFEPGNKYFLSTAGGISWILSNEDFLKDNRYINFLKLKASAGILGYDRSTEHLLYDQAWAQDGSFRFGSTATGATAYYSTFVRVANPNLKWEKDTEWNLGLEAAFFNNRLSTEINYFHGDCFSGTFFLIVCIFRYIKCHNKIGSFIDLTFYFYFTFVHGILNNLV